MNTTNAMNTMNTIEDYVKELNKYIDKTKQIPDLNIVSYLLNVIKNGTLVLTSVPVNLRNSKQIFSILVGRGYFSVLRDMDATLVQNVDFIRSLIFINEECYEYLPESCRSNEEITECAVCKEPKMFQHAALKLIMDINFCIKILKNGRNVQCIYALLFEYHPASNLVKIITLGPVVNYIPLNHRDNKELFLTTLKKGNVKIVKQLSNTLTKDVEFVKSLISLNVECYEHLPEICRDNEDITRCAVHLDKEMLQYASHRLRDDVEFRKKLMDEMRKFFPPTSTCWYNAHGVCHIHLYPTGPYRSCVANSKNKLICSVKHACLEVLNDLTFMQSAVQTNPEAFEYATEELRANKEFVKFALKLHPKLIVHVDPKLWNEFAYLY